MERDYGVWKFCGKEKAKLILSYLGLCGLVSWLFYHSFWAVLPFLAGLPVFLKKSREKRIKERREELLTEFLTGIRAIASACISTRVPTPGEAPVISGAMSITSGPPVF